MAFALGSAGDQGSVGKCHGECVRLRPRVGVGVPRERLAQAVGVIADRGDGLRKPAVHGTVHQQVAEGQHKHQWHQRNQNGAPQHARSQTGSQDAAALVCKELQQVAHQHDQDADEEQERNNGECQEDQRLQWRLGVEQANVEGVQGTQGEEQHKQAAHEHEDPRAPAAVLAHAQEFTPPLLWREPRAWR